MKKLLISPFLLLISFYPINLQAGNLGAADLMMNGVNATNLEEPKNKFDINVGKVNRKATAEFLNGKFIIKTKEKSIKKMESEGNIPLNVQLDESGIFPEQVISYAYHITRHGALWNIVYTLYYVDSDIQKQLATWGFGTRQKYAEDDAKNFNVAWLNWLNNK
tara:strand:- start:57 stop:545 length:489 start_codon:yes stop_codon:yes gene_type:complete